MSLLSTFLDEQNVFIRLNTMLLLLIGIMLALLVSLCSVVRLMLLLLLTSFVGRLQVNRLEFMWHLCLSRHRLWVLLRMSTMMYGVRWYIR